MTRKSSKPSAYPRDGQRGPRIPDWQTDRVFRTNRGWVPVKRCASCGRTCHKDQTGEWGADGYGERWYCGLHCLRDGEDGETFLSREAERDPSNGRDMDRTAWQTRACASSCEGGLKLICAKGPGDLELERLAARESYRGPPGKNPHTGPVAVPGQPPAQRRRIDWAEEGEDDGPAELCFGDFPAIR